MKKNIISFMLITAAMSAYGGNMDASLWTAQDSTITFLSSKINKQLNSITEQSSFTANKSQLDAEGNFTMNIDLSSVKTNIGLRDQRLKDWVFETGQFANAEISGKVEMSAINKLQEGEAISLQQPLLINIHGKKINFNANLSIQRNMNNKITVSTRTPVILDIKQMGMTEGVARMVEVMGLSSIVEQVPVSFDGIFTRNY